MLSTIVAEPELSEPAPFPLFITVALPPRPPPVAVAILALPVVEILPTLLASPVVIEGSVPELPSEVCPPLPTISAAGCTVGCWCYYVGGRCWNRCVVGAWEEPWVAGG